LIILSLTAYLGLMNLGIAQTVGNRIAEAIARGRRNEVKLVVATGFWAYMLIGGVLIVLMLIGASLVTPHYLGSSTTAICGPLIIYVALICAAMAAKIYQVALRGFERVDCEQALDAGSTLARTILSVFALMLGFKLVALALINGCVSLTAGILAYPIAQRVDIETWPSLQRFSWSCMRSLGRPSAAFLALQAGTTLTLGIDNLVIGAALEAAAVTRYAVPFRLIWMAALVFTIAVNAAMPTITGRYALAQREALTRYYLIALRLGMLFATCGAILLWTAGPLLIEWWAGSGVFPGDRVFACRLHCLRFSSSPHPPPRC
ncbi:MAG TPA: oligosaccharide flippase family protein, partial [Candidatus Binataceae bacterium]|nr:oligosaccharide flippase family protein [Candidatus Binataceae bacterium]